MKSCQPSWVKQKILECVWPFCVRIFCLRKKQNNKRKSFLLQKGLQLLPLYHNTIYLKILLHEMMVTMYHEGKFTGVVFIIKQKQERNINMTDCVSITIDNDVEQTRVRLRSNAYTVNATAKQITFKRLYIQ